MTLEDVVRYSSRSISGFRVRTILLLLAMSIGVASVVLLTSLGEGARLYVVNQFAELGTHLLVVMPGRSETVGGAPPLLGTTPRDLTLDDAMALYRSSAVRHVAPLTLGAAPASWRDRQREINVMGSTWELALVRQLAVVQGQFLPPGDPTRPLSVCVIGQNVKRELFGNANALGEWIRLNDRRFRVIGILAEKGQSIGVDFMEVVIIPVASAQALFNTSSLLRILIQAKSREDVPRGEKDVLNIIKARHDGEEDVTVIAQDAVLATFDRIFKALTLTVAGIAAISLAVAGILIMNVMLVSVSQRTGEIGLLKAVGAQERQILSVFLMESALLSLAGAALGIFAALVSGWVLTRVFPDFPVQIPLWSFFSAVGVALLTGLVFGIAPARRAAALDPVWALTRRG
jgi:putative ABC transport system permease protein